MKKIILAGFFLAAMFAVQIVRAAYTDTTSASAKIIKDTSSNADLLLPSGFKASIAATGLKGARHIAVTKQGGMYIKLSKLIDGKGIYYLRDTNGDGKIDEQKGFGDFPGTGIFIKKGYLYASSNDDVYRYKLNRREEVINPDNPKKIVSGLVNRNRDNAKSLAVDSRSNVYVNVGSYANSCLEGNSLKAPSPCPILDSAGGIWRFKANKKNQSYKDGVRYSTGLKHVVGLDWNTQTKSLFVMHHGRDRLSELYPQIYTPEQSGLLPAETMYELNEGADAGWPYVYYDHKQLKKVLSPEYGGDGKKTAGENALNPVAFFPAHLAPNGLLFYTGTMFPEKYRNGAFIAFHAKSAEIQRGYLVAFIAFKDGKPQGEWEIFADDFAGKGYYTSTTPIQHKPCGLAQGPDGALYVSDDAGGFIYRIEYRK